MREAFWLGCPINTYFLDWPTAAMYQRSSRGSYKMSGTRVPGNTLKTPFSVPMYLSNVGEFRNFLTLLSCTDHIDQSYGFYFHFIKLTLNCFHFKHTIFCPQLVDSLIMWWDFDQEIALFCHPKTQYTVIKTFTFDF